MVAHLNLASYVAIFKYQVVYSGAIGNHRPVSIAAIGANAANSHFVSRTTPVHRTRDLHMQRMAGLTGRNAATLVHGKGLLWAVLARKRELLSVFSALPLMAALSPKRTGF